MTLQQCKYVLTVAQEGSFSKAAKALYVSQSGLSESVKALESELGITIFGRSSNGVTLTDDGAEFLRYATVISAQDEFIRTRYANDRHDARLDVVTHTTTLLPTSLRDWCAIWRHPAIGFPCAKSRPTTSSRRSHLVRSISVCSPSRRRAPES